MAFKRVSANMESCEASPLHVAGFILIRAVPIRRDENCKVPVPCFCMNSSIIMDYVVLIIIISIRQNPLLN